jgi:hypothetical protein
MEHIPPIWRWGQRYIGECLNLACEFPYFLNKKVHNKVSKFPNKKHMCTKYLRSPTKYQSCGNINRKYLRSPTKYQSCTNINRHYLLFSTLINLPERHQSNSTALSRIIIANKVWTEAQHRPRSLESFWNPGIFNGTSPAVNHGSSLQARGRTDPSRGSRRPREGAGGQGGRAKRGPAAARAKPGGRRRQGQWNWGLRVESLASREKKGIYHRRYFFSEWTPGRGSWEVSLCCTLHRGGWAEEP